MGKFVATVFKASIVVGAFALGTIVSGGNVGVGILFATAAFGLTFRSSQPGKPNFGVEGEGPTHGTFGPLDNTISNELVVPVLYGQQLLAGNLIWQTDPGSTVSRIIGLCEGTVNSVTDVRANNNVISDTNTPGTNFTVYTGTNTQKADSRLPGSLRPDMELHNTAYIAMTITAGDVIKGGNPTITSIVQGLLVETWDGSVWSTTKSYSTNPIACVRDFLINARYGLGILKANIDSTTFGAAYDYCNQLVDGPSGKEVRFQLDYIADSQRPAQDILTDMMATFGGFLIYAGSTVKIGIEKAQPIIQYFGDGSTTQANGEWDPGNIVRDSFEWNISSVDDRPNRIKIQWIDPSQNYVKIYIQVEDRIDQDDRGTVIEKEVALLGISRQSQASRMAKLMMASIKYARLTATFAARLESIHCEIGDVVAITHQSAKFTRKLFRIVNMQEMEDETIQFVCREYNPFIYDDGQGSAIFTYTQPSGPSLFAPLSDVTGLTLREDNFKQKDGVFATNILATWTAIPADQLLRLSRHLVQLSSDGGVTFRDVAFAGPDQTAYRIVLGNVQTGTVFTVRVKTVSDREAVSPGVSATVTIQGKRTPPSNVSDFDVNFAFDHITMVWSSINDEDLFGYEIRVGNTNSIWETATIVTTETLGTSFDLFSFTRGSKTFFIKAIDNSGNYSETAAQDSITISNIPESNVVFTFDVWSRINQFKHPLEGTLSSSLDKIIAANFDPTYNRITFQPKTDKTWLQHQNTEGTWANFQASSFRWGRENYVTTQESYTTDIIDLGSVLTGKYILDIQTFSSSNLGFVSAYIATSTDGITFTSFVPFAAGQYSTRYTKLQFLIQATDPATQVRVISATLTIDIPDIRQSLLNQSVSAGGRTFFLTNFTSVKSIVITTVGTSNLTPRISSQSNLPNSFDVIMFDTSGTATAGSVNIFISGF